MPEEIPNARPNALGIQPYSDEESPNALGKDTESPNALGEIQQAGLFSTASGNELGGGTLGEMSKEKFVRVTGATDLKINPDLRVERRGDRDPVGYAVFRRGKKGDYVGYVGANSPDKDGLPSYSTIAKARNGE